MEQLVEVELGKAGEFAAPQDQDGWVEGCVKIDYCVVRDEEEDEVQLLVDVLFSVY